MLELIFALVAGGDLDGRAGLLGGGDGGGDGAGGGGGDGGGCGEGRDGEDDGGCEMHCWQGGWGWCVVGGIELRVDEEREFLGVADWGVIYIQG